MIKIRVRNCVTCGVEFSYPIGKGNDRKHCSEECRIKTHAKLQLERMKNYPICSVDGCNNLTTRKERQLCETHYMRFRRTGKFERQINYKSFHPAGYVKLNIKGHPLADCNNYVYEQYLHNEKVGLCDGKN